MGVPALGVDSMWPLPLGKKRELLGKFRVAAGGPTGSDGEDGDGEDDEELAVKAPCSLHFMYGEYHALVSQHTVRCGATSVDDQIARPASAPPSHPCSPPVPEAPRVIGRREE